MLLMLEPVQAYCPAAALLLDLMHTPDLPGALTFPAQSDHCLSF